MTTEEQDTTTQVDAEPASPPPAEPTTEDRSDEYQKRLAELEGIDDKNELRERALRAGQAATRSRQSESTLRREIEGLKEFVAERLGPASEGEDGEEDDDLPDASVDPVGHLKAYIDRRFQPIEEAGTKSREEAERRRKAEEQAKQWAERSSRDRQDFLPALTTEVFDGDEERATTDYDQAVMWFVTTRVEDKKRAHPQLSDSQAEQLVIAEDLMGQHGVFADDGANRAYALYRAALERGWKPGTIFYDSEDAGDGQGGAGGATPALSPPPTDARRRIEQERASAGGDLGMPASAGGVAPGARTKLGELVKDPKAYKREREKYDSMTDFLRAYGKLT